MRKIQCLSLLALFFVAACSLDAYEDNDQPTQDEIDENKPLSETWNVIPENYYAVNVAYYVPSDADTLTLWWKRLSGLTLHMQSFFEAGMVRHGYLDGETFGLVVNDSNQNYIEMNEIRSQMAASEMTEERMAEMADEVLAYFNEHSDRRHSDHFLVWLPEYDNSFIATTHVDADGVRNMITFVGCDTEKFDPKFLESNRGRQAYLGDLAEVLYEMTHNFHQTDNNGSMNNSRFSLTGFVNPSWNYTRYTADMNTVQLTEADAAGLAATQVFNSRDEYNCVPAQEVKVTGIRAFWKESEMEWPIYERDTLNVYVEFDAPQDLAGVILYVDPWAKGDGGTDSLKNVDPFTRTTEDAVAYWCPAEDFVGNSASFQLRWSDLHQANLPATGVVNMSGRNQFFESPDSTDLGILGVGQTKGYYHAELRFRFITKNGGVWPDPEDSPKGEWGSSLRYYFRLWRYWNGVYFGANMFDKMMPDVATRYGDQDEGEVHLWL